MTLKPSGRPRKRQEPKAAQDPITVVAKELENYASRGVFRSFSHTGTRNGQASFRFVWLLNLPFDLTFDTKRGAFVFKKLLKNVPPGSQLEADLKAFLDECCSPETLEHRRVDPRRVRVQYANRADAVTLTLKVIDGDYAYGTRRAIHLVNEVFLSFLNLRYPEYMISQFKLPDE